MEVVGNAVGIDLGKRTYEMCTVSQDGKKTRTGGKTDFAGIDSLCKKLKKMTLSPWKPAALLSELSGQFGKRSAAE